MQKKNLEKIILLRHELHENPELSLNEKKTKRRLMDFLEDNTNLSVVDCGDWFYASRYVEGTKAIAFRADMDALPINGISHACGHDGHCAALCGFALELEDVRKTHSAYLIFQHAEEIGKGGFECSKILKERNINEIYAFHNWSGWEEKSVIVRNDLCQCASEGLTVRFIGRNSHASEPEKGLNPSVVISKLALEINKIDNINKTLLTIVNIQVGEKNFGISPGEGEISLTLRSENELNMKKIENFIKNNAKKLADENGFKIEFSIHDYFPETVSNENCVKRIKKAAKLLNLNLIDMSEPIRASEDFGYYTKEIPGAIFYIGNGINHPAIHTIDYEFNDNILETASDIFLELYKSHQSR